MPTKNWQRVEMQIARDFGSTREKSKLSPDKKESTDFVTEKWLGEVKLRSRWPTPAQITEWFVKVQARAKAEQRKPVLCIKIGGSHGYWIVQESVISLWSMRHSSIRV